MSESPSAPRAASQDEGRSTYIVTDGGLPSEEPRGQGRLHHTQSSASTKSSDTSVFEIQYPLLRVPTSEDIEARAGGPRESETTAAHRRSRRSEAIKAATRSCVGASSGISLNSLSESCQEALAGTPHGEGKVDASSSDTAVKVVACRQVLASRDGGQFANPKSEEVLPLANGEELKRAASNTRGRAAATFALDDRADAHKTKSRIPRRPPPLTSQSYAPQSRILHRLSSVVHADQVARVRSAAPEAVLSVGYHRDHRHACREECLLYPLAALIFITFVLFVVSMWPDHGWKRKKEGMKASSSATCLSPSCFREAVYLNGLLSWNHVSPCQDFYSFVCRKYTASYATPYAGSSVSTDDDLAAFLEARLYASLQDDVLKANSNLSAILDLHSKCMDTKRIEDEEWNPLLELMSDVFLEGFPFTPPVRGSLSIWATAAKILRKTGTAALLGIGICANPATVHTDLLTIGLPDMVKINDYTDIYDASRLYITSAFAAMKALKKEHVPTTFTLDAFKFASDLTEIVGTTATKNISRVEILQSSSRLITFLEEIFRDVRSYYYLGIGTEIMIRPAPLVDEILMLAEGTDAHTVMNYLGVRLMVQVSPFIPNAGLADLYSVFLYGKQRGALPRWQLCVRATEKALFPLTYLSLLHDLRRHLSTAKLEDLAQSIITEFRRQIDASPYFTNSSKAVIRSILKNTLLRVAGPNWVNDSLLMDAYISGLPINAASGKSAVGTYVKYHEYTFLKCMARGSQQRWSRSAFTTTCWYEPHPDTIYVPLLVFNISRALEDNADVVQLSRAGPRLTWCVFDALLSKARWPDDIHGQWLTKETGLKLRNVEACLDSRESSPAFRLKRTRDVLAANLSYTLFLKSTKRSQKPLSLALPENHFLTRQQLFFVYLALQSCEQSGRSDNRPSSAGYDCNTALRNTKYFSEEYSCNAASPMNVQRKCLTA
ncbi:hypothetical protein V5799_018331 [Amblyomma americanum]|uniref:Peptidase M13 N-terminal domain-containing protein n=1 Tax=Amblyomma americanum TaxID=6943 RepID=A0AAQ4EZS6_AMBAM